MIKKILAWITGKSDTKVAEAAPYKIETPTVTDATGAEVAVGNTSTVVTESRYVGENEQGAIYEQVVVTPAAVVPAAIETAPVTVKAKYKKSMLNNLNKKELMELIVKHNIEVKSRSTKEELMKLLMKV